MALHIAVLTAYNIAFFPYYKLKNRYMPEKGLHDYQEAQSTFPRARAQSTSDYEISVYKEGDDALPKNLSWDYVGKDIEINGVKYKLISVRSSILDFIFEDPPMFNFLYNLITDNLKGYFNLFRNWVQDLEEGKASTYIKNSQDQNPKLEYFAGPPMREKSKGYVGMYYRLRLGESPQVRAREL